LPTEDRLFKQVDGWYFEFMLNVARLPNCMECGTRHGIRDKMVEHVNTLDKVQKALEEFLETKRQVFPRFYFLSNDELLEILGQSKNARAVQPHMRKCFDAISGLEFGDQASGAIDIFAMISPQGEKVQLTKNLKARGPVEEWLLEVQGAMKKSLHDLFKQGVLLYQEMDRPLWIMESKGQVVASISQVMWCQGTAAALRSDIGKGGEETTTPIQAWYNTNLAQLSQLTAAVRGQLTKIQRKIIVALCTVDVHARDIVKDIMDSNCESTDDFKWQQQLRTYWEDDIDDCIVRQATATIPYGYEYMGAVSRLVITPLTDRCWMTITSSLHLKLGAAPAGPAGTGKTESSKDLAKALGILCIVFNCSDQIDYKMTGKLFRGLAQQSAWTCLDEFNRIDIEVLSVVAQQLLVLRQARLSGTGRCNFEGLNIPVFSMHVIITMNPGYAGRTPLPDNLKVLFRPVAMMVPDYALIAEIMLFAEGFDDASNLSRKLWDLFKFSSEQLSQQKHYDYGLRAVKSVLVMAGAAKRANPDLVEDAVLIKAMRDSNVPKFLSADLPLFYAIIGDLFPGIEAPYDTNNQLKDAVVEQVHERGYQSGEKFVHKVIQLFQVFNTRFGACLVGPAGGGKTSVYSVLKDALTDLSGECDRQKISASQRPDLFNATQTLVLNPKAITMGELYGEYNLLTQEWKDGCGSGLMRECVRLSYDSELRRWVVFDGPIDAVWIENMNTVLDDNCMLCLANGQRIKLTQKMRMLFEVENLDEASPATVSRIGVIYVPDTALGWRPLVKSWLQRIFPKHRYSTTTSMVDAEGNSLSDEVLKEGPVLTQRLSQHIQKLFELLFVPAMKHRDRYTTQPVITSEMNAATTVCSLMEAMLQYDGGVQFNGVGSSRLPHENSSGNAENNNSNDQFLFTDISSHGQAMMMVERLFAFSLVWGVAGSVSSDHRDGFDDALSLLFEKAGCGKFLPGSGTSDTVYDYWLDPAIPDGSQGKGDFRLWNDVVPEFVYDEKAKFFDLVVPTVDTTCYSHLMELMVRDRKPVYLTGVTGTGKSVMATTLVGELQTSKEEGGAACGGLIINFSAKTSSQIIQGTIEDSLERKSRTLLGPPRGQSGMMIFVDDVNMPEVEIYGAQPPIELLRQLIDSKGFYEREEWLWRTIENSVLCVGAAPPGGGRSAVTQRFVRHFMVLCVPDPSNDGLQRIFDNILTGFLTTGKFHGDIVDLSSGIVQATIELYGRIREDLLPTPSRIHYQFNLRDVSKVFQGILMIQKAQCIDVKTMSKLWLHESLRVFSDRLINDEDRHYFQELIVDMLQRHFAGSGENWDMNSVFGVVENDENGEAVPAAATHNPIMFGHYLVPGAADCVYEECTSMSSVQTIMEEYLGEYNDPVHRNPHMSLVFFRSAVDHISRISRILRQPRGNAMLVGQGGSGKQSTTRLGCLMGGALFTQIELTATFGIFEFRECLKDMMVKAGVQGLSIGFSLTDTQIINEGFLEDVSSLLNSGSVPNLFESDEWERIIVGMSNVCKDLGYETATRDLCEKLFVSRVRDNLHVVLCLSPVGDKLRLRCLQFPSLINCCTIDWFSAWPEEALHTVATKALAAVDLPESDTDTLRSSLTNVCVKVHQCAVRYALEFNRSLGRNVYITPCSYLDLLNVYKTLLEEGRQQLQTRIDTLTLGVNKLEETNKVVNSLQIDLTKLQPVLKQKAKEAEELLKRVAIEKEEADIVRVRVSKDEAVVSKQKEEVEAITNDAQKDLDKALPALRGAIKALNAVSEEIQNNYN
jgi:dynein heavy chain, axonemal